jgi:hypothetical protein
MDKFTFKTRFSFMEYSYVKYQHLIFKQLHNFGALVLLLALPSLKDSASAAGWNTPST